GVYQARVESAENPFEQMIYLGPGQKLSITYPTSQREVLPSAAPVPGADAMHEYLRGPLDAAVRRPASKSKSCRIVVMATRPSSGPVIQFRGLRLLNEKGKEMSNLAKKAGSASGRDWKLFSQDVREGGWVVEWPADTIGAG